MDLMPIPTFTERITQKMETPVIYFYTDKEIDVNVKVDFPKGVISQWYPKHSKVNPSIAAKDGYAIWDVTVLKNKNDAISETSGNSIWNPSREVNSNIVKVGNEKEKLIFYRGLADFDTKLKVQSIGNDIIITNSSAQEINGLTLLKHPDLVQSIQSIKAHSSITISNFLPYSKGNHMTFKKYEDYLVYAKSQITKDLVASGLFTDEAVAMVNTWEAGYFKTPGLKLLYVLPREWTEGILPLAMTPAPEKLVRTLVGRVEILTEDDDLKIKHFVESKVANNKVSFFEINGREMKGLGHFPEPKLRRALELELKDGVNLKQKITDIIQTMNRGLLNQL